MSQPASHMQQETRECPAVAQRFLAQVLPACLAEGQQLAAAPVHHVDVLGRGSSSHAGTLLRYALATQTGLLVSAAMPSSAQAQTPAAGSAWGPGSLVVALSQSGQSPDLVNYVQARRAQGVRTLALVNAPQSPLGRACAREIVLQAGPERSVAATKSTVAAGLAGLGLACGLQPAAAQLPLLQALHAMPERLQQALACDWSAWGRLLPGARALFVVGRGACLGMAKEIALKVTETTGIPALAYSSAEFLHGPLGAVNAQTPVLGLCSDAEHRASLAQALQRAADRQAPCAAAAFGAAVASGVGGLPLPGFQLPLPTPLHRLADALLMLPPAYLALAAAASAMGRNPDAPLGLSKVTLTQ